jgi:hypothetical protein
MLEEVCWGRKAAVESFASLQGFTQRRQGKNGVKGGAGPAQSVWIQDGAPKTLAKGIGQRPCLPMHFVFLFFIFVLFLSYLFCILCFTFRIFLKTRPV